MNNALSLHLADAAEMRWAQATVTERHYLHAPVDVRGRPLAYIATLADDERVGCLIFARPEATRVNGWYGDVEDVRAGRCPITRWQVINLARVWLDPRIQRSGCWEIHNAATQLIAAALKRVVVDYLLARPVVWPDEPYELVECLSYCDATIHRGTLYRAANFRLVRENERGIQTYARTLRQLTRDEHQAIRAVSAYDQRARRLRALRAVSVQQPELLSIG